MYFFPGKYTKNENDTSNFTNALATPLKSENLNQTNLELNNVIRNQNKQEIVSTNNLPILNFVKVSEEEKFLGSLDHIEEAHTGIRMKAFKIFKKKTEPPYSNQAV